MPKTTDTSYHRRRIARRKRESPEFRAAYERRRHELAQVNRVVRMLDTLRAKRNCSKAELARLIGKNPSSVRRLLTAEVNPELITVVALADALDADVQIVPRKATARRRSNATRRSTASR